MTIEEIRQCDREILVPREVAEVLHADPAWVRYMARQKPEMLGFPVIVAKSRVKIPRRPFLKYMGVELI